MRWIDESWLLEGDNVRYRLEVSLNFLDDYTGCHKVITAREVTESVEKFAARIDAYEGDQYLPSIEEVQPEREESESHSS